MKRPWIGKRVAGAAGNQESSQGVLERSARRWLRAYPQRWRVTFGDDLIGILLEVSEPDARRVTPRAGLEILLAGWALRWRERPPLWKWLGYRMFGRRLPEQFHFWVIDDLLGALFGARIMVATQVVYLSIMSAISGTFPQYFGPSPHFLKFVIFYLAIVSFVTVFGRRYRARGDWRKFIGTEPPRELQPRRHRRLQTEA